jgi:outer membrane protein assembly factor BamB
MIIRLCLLLAACACFGQISVLTSDYDLTRDGQNNQEPTITPDNVTHLKKIWSSALDGAVLSAQTLYVKSADNGTGNDWVVASTLNNSVYALNAKTGAQIWRTNLGSTWTTPFTGVLYSTAIGIVSTPVIDVTNGWIFVVWASSPGGTPTYTLAKLALSTGASVSSVVVSGSVTGSGCGSSSGTLAFNASQELQRTPLTLVGGNVYFGFGAGNEPFTWHGWVFGYAESNLAQVGVMSTTPDGCGGGVWMNIASDGTYLYFATGNGDYNGTSNFAQSIIKTSLSLGIVSSFTPSNWSSTSSADADLASGKVMLIPSTNYLTISSKDGRGWVLDKTAMCGLQGGGCSPQQVFTVFSLTPGGGTGTYGGMFFTGNGVFPIALQPTDEFSFSSGTYTTPAEASTVASFGQVAATYTSNGGANGIVWALTVDQDPGTVARQVTLRAFNPATLVEYWNSGTLGEMSKFSAPTVVNGMVFVNTFDSGLQAFGLLPSSAVSGLVTITGQTTIQ